jgi:hypothetical protein
MLPIPPGAPQKFPLNTAFTAFLALSVAEIPQLLENACHSGDLKRRLDRLQTGQRTYLSSVERALSRTT